MKMKIKILLGCVILGMASSFAAQEFEGLDIIIRDFKPDHPDFENFSEEYISTGDDNYCRGLCGDRIYATGLWGYQDDWYALGPYHMTCGNHRSGAGAIIGQDGYPKVPNPALPPYLQVTSNKQPLEYGECSQKVNGRTVRGYAAVAADNDGFITQGYVCPGGGTNWANTVYYTPGMVQTYLAFGLPDEKGEIDMYDSVFIRKAGDLCDNYNFAQWYTDVPGVNLRTNALMDMDPVVDNTAGSSRFYFIDKNYNNGGYAPLDSINPTTGVWEGNKACNAQIQPNKICESFGPQSLSIFCPPYDYQYESSQTDYLDKKTNDLCTSWKAYGGPRVTDIGDGWSAAEHAARDNSTPKNGNLGMQHLRNYAFTMMGYAKFRYKASNQVPTPEVFEFTGDDDMWIFVDGVLAVDLGGTHLAAPGRVNIATLAKWNHGCHEGEPLSSYSNCEGSSDASGWADGTWHHLHFFYADRQTDGSNLYIRTSLAEVAPSRYGQPAVGDAVVKVDENGNVTNSLFLNTSLDPTTTLAMTQMGAPSIIVIREVTDPVSGAKTSAIYGYVVSSISEPTDKGASGILYNFDGNLVDLNDNVIPGGLLGGDKIAFNVEYSNELLEGNDGGFTTDEWNQLMTWSKKMTFKVQSVSGKAVEGFDGKEDWANIQYTAVAVVELIPDDPAISRPDFTQQAEDLSNAAGSDGLKEDMTADLVLTSIPAVMGSNPLTWATDNADILMKSTGGAVPTSVNGVPVFATNVSGLKQGTNQTLCFNDGSPQSGNSTGESCTSFAFATTQPFHVNIRVFDHLGNFVNQFNKSVTEEDFKKALGTGVPVAGCEDKLLYGGTGAMLANVKVYPVAKNGRLLATGPYIYQVAIVMEKYEYCYMSNGASPTIMTMPYMRTSETYRRGYRRAPKK